MTAIFTQLNGNCLEGDWFILLNVEVKTQINKWKEEEWEQLHRRRKISNIQNYPKN